jgi:hypothetical protein
MSNPRIPENFYWDFKKNMKMTPEERQDMLNQEPELNALIKITNQEQEQDENVAQNNDNLQEFNYKGELGNNHEDEHDEGNNDLL